MSPGDPPSGPGLPLGAALADHRFDGFATRESFVAALWQRLDTPDPGRRWSLLLLGIDHLGRMNEIFGYEVVDQMVAETARRLRAAAPPEAILCRFSGAKFALLQAHADPASSASPVQAVPPGAAVRPLPQGTSDPTADLAECLCAALRALPVETSAGPLPVSVSAGGVRGTGRPASIGAVIAAVEEAQDRAKRTLRGSFQLFEEDPARERRRRLNQKAAEDIVRAVWEHRISLALQPVVRIATRQVVFHEALARISARPGQVADEPVTGAEHPAEAAERLGLIGFVDREVLAGALLALRRDPTLTLSVNVSPASISDRTWMEVFQREASTDIAGRLILELTESVAVNDLDGARLFVRQARARGARVALDDFGAGSTSFRNLRALDVDMVKIDGSFVLNMGRSADDRAFVRALIQLAHQIGVTTVAEWVQDEATARELADFGCDLIQGALTGLATPYAVPEQSHYRPPPAP